MEKAERRNDGSVCWRYSNFQGLCGISHGGAGFAWSLIRAWNVTKDDVFREIAIQALDYERSLFDESEGNWPDLQEYDGYRSNRHRFMSTWCHGAPGICLSRAGISTIEELPGITDEIHLALQKTKKTKLRAHHLCCGEMGLCEVLLETGRRLNDEQVIFTGRQRVIRILDAAKEAGGYLLNPILPPNANVLGLMRGISGVGYGLLRYADESSNLPVVLLLA